MKVLKRDGRYEDINIEKIHKVLTHACKGLKRASVSEIVVNSELSFYEGMPTSNIQEILIKSAGDLVSLDYPDYQFVAGRLVNYQLRKQIYRSPRPYPLYIQIYTGVKGGYYTNELLESYTEDEIEYLEKFIKHNRDFNLSIAAMTQFRSKYLAKNKRTGEIYETPQMAYMLIAMMMYRKWPNTETRLQKIVSYYDEISTHKISLPTPIMAGLRTKRKQFSSCVVIDMGDSINSIFASVSAIGKYISNMAGIGLNMGRIRGEGAKIRNGDTSHTGTVPFIKVVETTTGSCNSGGVRPGAATVNFPIWHFEVEKLIVLKNNKGTENNRARHLDYCFHSNKLFYQRYQENGVITLFRPNQVPDLYAAFYSGDNDLFKKLYETYEKDESVDKKTVGAQDFWHAIMVERKTTTRIYIMNVDHANSHSSFTDPVFMTNLCAEITIPTMPFEVYNNGDGRIGLCTLSAINWGLINTPTDFEQPCREAVYALNELLNTQHYPVLDAQRHTEYYRPLGIGIINFAYFLAKNKVDYGSAAGLALVHEYAEAWSYYLIKASVEYAKETGIRAQGTKYAEGILPIDTYKKDVDNLASPTYRFDWNALREDIKKHGIANGCLMACMPAETSAQLANATNGIEPIVSLVMGKRSGDGIPMQVAPESRRLGKRYHLRYEQGGAINYLKTMAVLQKFMDQSISSNTSYNPEDYPNKDPEKHHKIPMKVLMEDMLLGYKYGIKTYYYFNSPDGNSGKKNYEDKEDLPVEIPDEEEACEGCKL